MYISIVHSFLGFTCGDQCLKYGKEDHREACERNGVEWESQICQSESISSRFTGESVNVCKCGHDIISHFDMQDTRQYCCNSDVPCQKQGNTIICQNGTLLNVNDRCGKTCATAERVSSMAIATKKACGQENDKCYQNMDRLHYQNSVCNRDGHEDESEFANKFCGSFGGVPCYNKYTNGQYNKIGQCYNSRYIGLVNYFITLKCLILKMIYPSLI